MIYTASYFQPENHHGRCVAISRSVPKHFTPDDRLIFLAPSAALLRNCKLGMSNEAYTDSYRDELRDRWAIGKPWLMALDPGEDQTLLCWEHKGNFCHRNLVGLMAQKQRPECWGRADVEKLEKRGRIDKLGTIDLHTRSRLSLIAGTGIFLGYICP